MKKIQLRQLLQGFEVFGAIMGIAVIAEFTRIAIKMKQKPKW